MRRATLLWGVFVLPGNGALFHAEAERVFPMNHKLDLKKQLACIYTNNFFSGLRITDAVWVALLAARGFSLWEIGVAESVFHMVSLTFEVPSGMAADLLGRRKTLVAGGVCMVLSNLLMAFAPDLFFICLAMALSALANAMFSGTASALTYDSLKQCGQTDDYLRVSANCSQLSMLATAVGSLASTLERFLRFSGFYLLSAAFEGTAAAATALMTEREKRRLLADYEGDGDPMFLTEALWDSTEGLDPVSRMQQVDINLWLAGDILLKADKMSMAHSLELRVPFLDREVWALAAALPAAAKADARTTKIALRQAAARTLPAASAARKKLGFPVPVRDWLRQEPYTSRVRAVFSRPAAAEFFDPRALHSMLNQHLHGGDCWRQIWCVYSFLIWYEQFFGA